MLNIQIKDLREFVDKQLEILNMNIKRNNDCKYIHEYICIDIKTFTRYKITFETNQVDVVLSDENLDTYGVTRFHNVKLNSIMLNANKHGEIFTITTLD